MGSMPLAVTQEDCLVYFYVWTRCIGYLFMLIDDHCKLQSEFFVTVENVWISDVPSGCFASMSKFMSALASNCTKTFFIMLRFLPILVLFSKTQTRR